MVDARAEDIDTYAVTRDELIVQLRALSDADAAEPVSACPEWTVKDVVAHVCGLNAELLAGVKPPLGTDERTAAQVGSRRSMTLADICDEWQTHADPLRALMATNLPIATGLTADLAVHVHDLAEDITGIAVPPVAATTTGCRRYAPLLQERLAATASIALTIELDDGTRWAAQRNDHTTALTLRCTPTAFLRSVTGRRTRAQTAALGWSGPADRALDHFTQYGPFRVD